jgi:hypothetical protein
MAVLWRIVVATAALGVLFSVVAQQPNPLDQSLPADALSLVGMPPDSFVSRIEPLRFALTGTEFYVADSGDVRLTINGVAVSGQQLSLTPGLITAPNVLVDGRNQVSLKAYDTVGRPLYFNATLWAGAARLRVELVNPDSTPFLGRTEVSASPVDDPSVRTQVETEEFRSPSRKATNARLPALLDRRAPFGS